LRTASRDHAVLARALALAQGAVRLADDLLDRDDIEGYRHHADARGDPHGAVADTQGPVGDDLPQAFADLHRLARARGGEEDQELVTPDPRDGVLGPQGGDKTPGDVAQHDVADGVPQSA